VRVLAKQLRQRRFADAALDLEVPECEVVIGPDARMTGVRVVPHDESHQLIEECMVAANEAVATELETRGIRIISRLHEAPDLDKMEDLRANLATLGIKAGDLSDPQRLARFLNDIADHPLRTHAHTMVLRSMKRAIYSAESSGHFGLAKQHYAHFTSPIRRYPDLILHRQLASFLAGEGGKLPSSYLKAMSAFSTEREQNADDASRALIEIKKFRFLQQQLEEKKLVEYKAVVTRVANFGLFVDVQELQMPGMVHISMISDNFVRFNPGAESLTADNTTYRIGTHLSVYVARVDFDQRRADFTVVRGSATNKPIYEARPPTGSQKGRPADREMRFRQSRNPKQPRSNHGGHANPFHSKRGKKSQQKWAKRH